MFFPDRKQRPGHPGASRLLSGLCLAATLLAPSAEAEEPHTFLPERVDLLPVRETGLVRGLRSTGRIHYDFVNLDTDLGDQDYAEFRRFRTGFLATFAGGWELKGEVDLDPNQAEPLYSGLAEAWVAWHPDADWTLKAGKQTAFFTLEGSTSSNELLTLERGNLVNNLGFPLIFMPGLSLAYKEGPQLWYAGLFSGGSRSPEFGDFDASGFALLRTERDLAERFDLDEAILGLHAVFQDPDPSNTFTRPNQQVFSLNFRGREGPWRLQGDLARSHGYDGQSDLTGLVLMPVYDLSPSWQLVARATLLESDDPGGIRPGRYERRLSPVRGEHYGELYLGVNHYLQGQRLKWQAGISRFQLGDLEGGGDYEGWNFTSGIRMHW